VYKQIDEKACFCFNERMKKDTDARKLSQKEQALLRRKAVDMVLAGRTKVETAQILGISRLLR